MTMREVIQKYFDTMHNYIPISRVKIDKQVQEAETLNSKGAFMVLIMAIILFTEHPTAHSNDALGLSELYQVCKYHFSLFLSLKDPSIELIQAGLCMSMRTASQNVPISRLAHVPGWPISSGFTMLVMRLNLSYQKTTLMITHMLLWQYIC